MSIYSKVWSLLSRISIIKTIIFNFKYLPFKQAIKFPILISRNLYIETFSGKVIIRNNAVSGSIKIGFGKVGIFDEVYSRSIWEVLGTVIFKGRAELGHGSRISVGANGTLILGERFSISANTTIIANEKIEIGNHCLLSWDILIMDTDFHKIKNANGQIINKPEAIIIGDKVWIGCRCLILKGSIIPSGCVIGANATITEKLISENTVYAGNPAREIMNNIEWDI